MHINKRYIHVGNNSGDRKMGVRKCWDLHNFKMPTFYNDVTAELFWNKNGNVFEKPRNSGHKQIPQGIHYTIYNIHYTLYTIQYTIYMF